MTATTELTRHLLRLNADDLERVAAAIVDRTDSGVAPLIDDWRRDQCIELDDNEPDYLAHGLCFLAAEMRAVELDPSELEPSDAIVRDLELLVQQRTRVA